MDRQSGYLNVFPGVDPSYLNYGSGSGGMQTISPYLNVDPAYLSQGGPEWIFPEGATQQRGRLELAFSQIGGAVMIGACIGGIKGVYSGLNDAGIKQQKASVRRTQMLNYITKGGAASGNALGVLALMYAGFGVIVSKTRGIDDELNTVIAGTATGLLFKSTAGLRRCGIGGALGLAISAAYSLWTSKDRIF